MTERQIIERIRTLTDVREVDSRLRVVHTAEDYLHALQAGERKPSLEWLDSSDLAFPEDFAAEMNRLSVDLTPIDKMLGQLGRIEDALKLQRAQILSKS